MTYQKTARGKEGGIIAFYIPNGVLEMVEATRSRLGMNRSKFIQYCILRTLQDLSVVSKAVHKEVREEMDE